MILINHEKNLEYLHSVKKGDEVCLTNTHNVRNKLFHAIFSNSFPWGSTKENPVVEEVCEILKVAAITKVKDEDGESIEVIIVHANNGEFKMFKRFNGKPLNESGISYLDEELFMPVDDLRLLSEVLQMIRTIRNTDFMPFSVDRLKEINNLIYLESIEIHKRGEAERQKAIEEAQKKKDSEKESGLMIANTDAIKTLSISDALSSGQFAMQPSCTKCTCDECTKEKNNESIDEV